jgi:hypothetical protein
MSWIAIGGLVAALGFGVYLGLPRRFDQSLEDIDRRLDERGEHAQVKRKTTFIGLMQRRLAKGSDRRRAASRRRPFRL